ncbi:MAG: sulfite exporter TauE/SafE family protein, partial [Methylobacteriaceae bacterium]|jgi:sulfite exporter TauE/SafE|nr:sulfite exporter TauE/SafE family protein [Methylobacteriaceae bacterium]
VISYTLVGFVVGALGSVLTFSPMAQGMLKLAAGVFMVIMGVNMLGVFPALRRLNPRLPKFLADRVHAGKAGAKSPLYVGLLNGLMPCGPLQAMQIYALSTGSAVAGAFSMFMFSAGTVPLMFGLGALSSMLGGRFTQKVMTAGATLVVVLGLSMLTQGWMLAGFAGPGFFQESVASQGPVRFENGRQIVRSTLTSSRYPSITVQVGVPVRWIIDAPPGSINGCNNRMIIPEYRLEHEFTPGENVIEFTPGETGRFSYSCWMGMIRATIRVVASAADIPGDAGGTGEAAAPQESDDFLTEPIPSGIAVPADQLAVARYNPESDRYQEVAVELTDEGFRPAVVVVQYAVNTKWIINNKATEEENFTLLVPAFKAKLELQSRENSLGFKPGNSFEFSNGNSTAYGFVKVVKDVNAVDEAAVKKEAAAYETKIWPSSTYREADAPRGGGGGGGGGGCH